MAEAAATTATANLLSKYLVLVVLDRDVGAITVSFRCRCCNVGGIWLGFPRANHKCAYMSPSDEMTGDPRHSGMGRE